MLKKIYLMGRSGSGKTAIALGFSLLWKEKGFKVSYLKPKTAGPNLQHNQDVDALLFKKTLGLPWEPEQIAPLNFESLYIFGPSDHNRLSVEKMEARLDESFREIAYNDGIIVIEGGRSPYAGMSLALDDFSLAKRWETPVLFISNLDKDDDLDQMLFFNNFIQARGLYLLGNIFNNVTPAILSKARDIYQPLLEEKGYKVLGIIPAHPAITFPTVAEFHEALKGEILSGEGNMGLPVEEIVVGTMTIEGALSYLRRALNKAVITGGDRSDMALTALETSISVLILTGGLQPDIRVISRAREKGVPVILVHFDTYTAIGMLQGLVRQIRPQDSRTITLIKEEVARHCSWEKIAEEMESYRFFSTAKGQ
ncbi:MAG: phosphotransacetylase family protein [Dethiobacter sp.]|nr:MAG: phosphotransacetylase family protein [Dethiobacter sp.]